MTEKNQSPSRMIARRRKIIETFSELRKEYDDLTEVLKKEISYDINGNQTGE